MSDFLQEIQASQNVRSADTSFAYNIFSKGIDTHSSILEPGFKKPPPPPPSTTTQNNPSRLSLKNAAIVRPSVPVRPPVINQNTNSLSMSKVNNVPTQPR